MLKNKIKQLRQENHFTQSELAERIQVSRQTISKWESGMAVPDAERLAAIADLFCIEVGYLLAKEDDVKPREFYSENSLQDVPGVSAKAKTVLSDREIDNMGERIYTPANHSSTMEKAEADWGQVVCQLERYNNICSQRLSLIKFTIKWVLIWLACMSILTISYKIYEMHFDAIGSAEQNPIETYSSMNP